MVSMTVHYIYRKLLVNKHLHGCLYADWKIFRGFCFAYEDNNNGLSELALMIPGIKPVLCTSGFLFNFTLLIYF